MQADGYRGFFGRYCLPVRSEKHGLLAMFQRGAGAPYAINAQRLPLIKNELQKQMQKAVDSGEAELKSDIELTLTEIETAIMGLQAFMPTP